MVIFDAAQRLNMSNNYEIISDFGHLLRSELARRHIRSEG